MAGPDRRFESGSAVNSIGPFSVFELGCLGNRASLFFGLIIKIPYVENFDQFWDLFFVVVIGIGQSLLKLFQNQQLNISYIFCRRDVATGVIIGIYLLNVKLTRLCEEP